MPLRIAKFAGLTLLGLVVAMAGTWAVLAIFYSGVPNEIARIVLAGVFAVLSLAAVICLGIGRWRWRALAAYLLLFAVLVMWWEGSEPSNQGDWQADVAMLPWAEVRGDTVTMHNIRNFTYRSEFDYTPAYYDKSFDLSKLEGVDVVAVYWMGPAVAHVFLSFAFAGGEHLAVSIETRKQKGQAYSTLAGFFRQYTLMYIVADERDVIGLRTNYRRDPPEQVYLYRTKGSLEAGQRLFLQYVRQINRLKDTPEFYNSLTTNCTTSIWRDSFVNAGHLPLSWKILASGYVPEYLFENGRLETGGLTFAELQQQAHINARAQAAGITADFSRLIRQAEPVRAAVGRTGTTTP
jgi:hypothetical protein